MTSIHRLLDEAFAGIALSPDVQDLKEEIRANLAARAAELEAAGRAPDAAAQRAVEELGDVRALVASWLPETAAPGDAAPTRPATAFEEHAAAWERHRVRPRPGFAVRATLLPLIALAGLLPLALSIGGVLELSLPVQLLCAAAVALPLGVVVGDALHQETSYNFAMPLGRAIGFGTASALVIAALPVAALGLRHGWGWFVAGAALLVVGIPLFAYLGATQTNRAKPWARSSWMQQEWEHPNRFTTDQNAAARFGIYTAVLWIVAIVVFLVVGFVGAWAWSWLALVGALVVMLLLLTRMMFGGKPGGED